MLDIIKNNKFLSTYHTYVEHTEPPIIMHTWAAVAVVAAAMGRHTYYPFPLGDIYANQYILLVGPPATRKSTAVKLASKLLREHTNVEFAPDDTGGQRQGLIAAMEGRLNDDTKETKDVMAALEAGEFGMDVLDDAPAQTANKVLDMHCRYAQALEFGSFIGQNNTDMTRFLIRVWDGDPYEYKLKNSVCTLEDGLLTIAGATTPEEIAKCMPMEAMGQGFMSRIIFVYAPTKAKEVPPSRTKLCMAAKGSLEQVLSWISNTMSGPMSTTQEVDDFVDEIYSNKVTFEDNRFTYYTERRFTHVIKLAMCLCAMRMSTEIIKSDMEEAIAILTYTERFMPDALGEYGMSALSAAKQTLVEYLTNSGEPVSAGIISNMMARDLNPRELSIVLSDLIAAKKIEQVNLPAYGTCYVACTPVDADVLQLLKG